jgi:hypothetical protein
MRSLPRVPRSAPRPRLYAHLTVAAVSLSAAAAALLAGGAAPVAGTQQVVIVTDLGAGQPAPTVVTPPPVAGAGATVRPPVTAP